MNRKKRSKAERINEQLRLELLKLDPSKKEPPPADTDKVRYRKGEKLVYDEQLGGWFKVVDPFSHSFTKMRPDSDEKT